MTSDMIVTSTHFVDSGTVDKRTTLPDGVIQVTISTSTNKQPGYYCSGGHYNYRKRGDMVGAPGDWFASYIVVSKAGSLVQAYPYISGAMEPDDINAPIAVTYTKIG